MRGERLEGDDNGLQLLLSDGPQNRPVGRHWNQGGWSRLDGLGRKAAGKRAVDPKRGKKKGEALGLLLSGHEEDRP